MEYNSKSNFMSSMKRILLSLLLILALPVMAYAQKAIKGTVTDANGDPLMGVTVLVKGTSNGVSTNMDGNFSIQAKNGETLKFSYIGMVSQEVKIAGNGLIKVTLKENDTKLDEVIVVGYGKQKKSSLTGAVSAINGEELLQAPSTNVSQLLGGKIPGISSLQTSGEPGLDQASLRLRGSIYGVTYIVDGVPREINDIDPNDIASISALKDASAAAIYGLQAAGGVIIITTKKGKTGKAKITYDGSVGASVNANFPDFMNGVQFMNYFNMGDMMDQLANGVISDRSQYSPKYTSEMLALVTNGDATDGYDNMNYIDRVFGTGTNTKHNVSVAGGNDNSNYYASVGYLGQEGNIDNFTYNRYTARVNLDSKLAQNWTLSMGLSGKFSDRKTPGLDAGSSETGSASFLSIARQTIAMHPYLSETYDGLYTAVPSKNSGLPQSPLGAIYDSGYKKTNSVDISANMSLQFDVPWVKGLSAKVSGAYDWSNSYNKNLSTPYYVNSFAYNGSMQFSKVVDGRNQSYITLGEGSSYYSQMLANFQIDYAREFGEHEVKALFLGEMRENKSNSLAAYARDLNFAGLPELSFGKPEDTPISGGSYKSRAAGLAFRLNYDYADKYLVEFTGRYDGSYKFNGNVGGKRWGFFPSASIGWRVSKEAFMEATSNVISDFKIRASYGLLGNDGVPAYSYLTSYGYSSTAYINGQVVQSLIQSGIANPYLTWEKTSSLNAGFDMTLWNGKLGIDFDVFYNHNTDILSAMGGNMPPSMGGYYMSYANNNEIDSKGFDLSLTSRHTWTVAGSPLTFTATGNVSYAYTRWVKYPDSPNIPEWRKVVGTSYYSNYGWIADGLYRTEEEIDNSAWYGTRPNLGDIKYVDLNGDGKIDWQDRSRIGDDSRPRWTYGLNLGATWKGFDVNAQFTGGAGFVVSMTGTYYNGYDDNTIWTQSFKEQGNSPLYLVQDAWSIDNPNGTMPRLTVQTLSHGGDNGLASTFWLRKGDYIRLKSAQIGYTLPSLWMSKVGIEKLRVYVEGSNLFTLDTLPEGLDPESPQVNNGYYPQQRTFMGGLTLTF